MRWVYRIDKVVAAPGPMVDETREVGAGEARQLQGLGRFASLPATRRSVGFDFDAQPAVDLALANELGTLCSLDDATNVMFIGRLEIGKAMLAVYLARRCSRPAHSTPLDTVAGPGPVG